MAKYLLFVLFSIGLYVVSLSYEDEGDSLLKNSSKEVQNPIKNSELEIYDDLTDINESITYPQDVMEQNQDVIATQDISENLDELVSQEEIEASLKHVRSFSNWLHESKKNSKDFNLREQMDLRFSNELLDSYWATEQEGKIQELFFNDEALAEIALKEVVCRSTQCVVSVHINNIEQANNIISLVLDAIDEPGKFYNIIATPNEDTGETRLYIKDNDQSFYAQAPVEDQSQGQP